MRVFIGLELTESMRDEAARIAQAAQKLMPGKYVEPTNYHCTLAYVGEADEEMRGRVSEALAQAAGKPLPACALAQASFFHKPEKAILYCGLQSCESLMQAALAVRRELARRHVPHDPAPFLPHITLARGVCIDQAALDTLNPEGCGFRAPYVTLFESARVDGMLRYTPIERVQWRG